ncbi:MAG: hypothetical protein ACK4VL_12180, partial [Chitinophagales bacterium]
YKGFHAILSNEKIAENKLFHRHIDRLKRVKTTSPFFHGTSPPERRGGEHKTQRFLKRAGRGDR